MYEATGKATPAKFRARLATIVKCAESGEELAKRWNPKGRHYETRRQMIRYFKDTAEISRMLLEELKRRRHHG